MATPSEGSYMLQNQRHDITIYIVISKAQLLVTAPRVVVCSSPSEKTRRCPRRLGSSAGARSRRHPPLQGRATGTSSLLLAKGWCIIARPDAASESRAWLAAFWGLRRLPSRPVRSPMESVVRAVPRSVRRECRYAAPVLLVGRHVGATSRADSADPRDIHHGAASQGAAPGEHRNLAGPCILTLPTAPIAAPAGGRISGMRASPRMVPFALSVTR